MALDLETKQTEMALDPETQQVVTIPARPTNVQVDLAYVTPGQAAFWLEKCRYPYQRSLSRLQVDFLVQAIERGQFHQWSPVTVYYWDGKAYLLDGQHRLTAMRQTGASFWVTLIGVQAQSWDEVRHAYARLTDRRRSMADRLKGSGIVDQIALTTKQTRRVGYAASVLLQGFDVHHQRIADTQNADLREALVRYLEEDAVTLFALYADAPGKWRDAITTAMPLAVALVTMHYDRARAIQFWGSLARRDLAPPSPVAALTYFLTKNKSEQVRMSQRQVGERPYLAAIAHLWNMGYQKKKLRDWNETYAKEAVREASPHIKLLGTPYDGTRRLTVSPDGSLP
jgi:hypothetical protein